MKECIISHLFSDLSFNVQFYARNLVYFNGTLNKIKLKDLLLGVSSLKFVVLH